MSSGARSRYFFAKYFFYIGTYVYLYTFDILDFFFSTFLRMYVRVAYRYVRQR